jgi:hypothetical protein
VASHATTSPSGPSIRRTRWRRRITSIWPWRLQEWKKNFNRYIWPRITAAGSLFVCVNHFSIFSKIWDGILKILSIFLWLIRFFELYFWQMHTCRWLLPWPWYSWAKKSTSY